jgi:hypothetical protein
MSTGATASVNVSMTNTGALTWSPSGANPTRLSYHWRNGSCPGTSGAVWDGLRTALSGDVPEGGSVSNLAAQVRAPNSPGTYCLQFDIVREGVTWFSSQGAAMSAKTVTVSTPVYGVSWTAQNTPAGMASATNYGLKLSFTNTGSLTWNASGANPVRVSYHWLDGACPGTTLEVWDGVRSALSGNISTGGSANNLDVAVRSPNTAGTYCLVYDPVREGITWFGTQGAQKLTKTVTVTTPALRVTWNSQSTPSSMTAGTTIEVTLGFSNSGTSAWNASGANPVRISYHWRSGACPGGGSVVWDGLRSPLGADVSPGSNVAGFTADLRAPSTPGTYCLEWDVVKEGVAWFSNLGSAKLTKTVTVN